MDGSIKMKLAGREWEIAPFTLGEQRTVVPLVYSAQKEMRTNGLTTFYFDTMITLLLYVVKRADPSMTPDIIRSLPVDITDLSTALITVGHLSGMEKRKEGEKTGVVTNPLTTNTSTDSSPTSLTVPGGSGTT